MSYLHACSFKNLGVSPRLGPPALTIALSPICVCDHPGRRAGTIREGTPPPAPGGQPMQRPYPSAQAGSASDSSAARYGRRASPPNDQSSGAPMPPASIRTTSPATGGVPQVRTAQAPQAAGMRPMGAPQPGGLNIALNLIKHKSEKEIRAV